MLSGDVKVVNVIAHVVAVSEHAAARAHRQVKCKAALVSFAARSIRASITLSLTGEE